MEDRDIFVKNVAGKEYFSFLLKKKEFNILKRILSKLMKPPTTRN